ncbi:MAG: YbaB/EbfC family nucleoid-associated protein [Solobacterium sp.]|jgi:DNA-binding YbaB/EbfC family protein|nr:YbaB/EbfC family nucleoid-associated protein [Solobacterium sp.]MBR2768705.1 YbaB/EbfC family nucleoid-associated protein [Solobacterium sp.]MBR2794119.1 YbaB/EbfC family nucleoid-associated protein [Solobacterium sp.]
MDMRRLMEQAQQMQKKLKKIEDELNETVYEGVSGGSTGVSVKMNGRNEIIEVNINEELLDKENKEELQDMILLAVNNAVDQAKSEREEKMGAITQGVSIPGM